jgi:hypothetical protein
MAAYDVDQIRPGRTVVSKGGAHTATAVEVYPEPPGLEAVAVHSF